MIKHAIPAVNSSLWSLDVGDVRYCPININIYWCIILIQITFWMLTVLLNANNTILLHQQYIAYNNGAISSHSIRCSLYAI